MIKGKKDEGRRKGNREKKIEHGTIKRHICSALVYSRFSTPPKKKGKKFEKKILNLQL